MVRPTKLKFGMRVYFNHRQLVLSEKIAQRKKIFLKAILSFILPLITVNYISTLLCFYLRAQNERSIFSRAQKERRDFREQRALADGSEKRR